MFRCFGWALRSREILSKNSLKWLCLIDKTKFVYVIVHLTHFSTENKQSWENVNKVTQNKLRPYNVYFQKLSPWKSSRLVGRKAKYLVSMRFLRRKSFLLSAAVGNGGVTTNAIRSLALSSRCCKIWCNGVKCCLNMLFSVQIEYAQSSRILWNDLWMFLGLSDFNAFRICYIDYKLHDIWPD